MINIYSIIHNIKQPCNNNFNLKGMKKISWRIFQMYSVKKEVKNIIGGSTVNLYQMSYIG